MRRRARSGIIAVTLAAATLTACADDPPDVAIVGDSITDMSREPINARFDGAGMSVSVVAVSGGTAPDVLDDAQPLGAVGPSQVIINLGTNDVTQRKDPVQTVADIVAVVDLFPDARCVHVATINEMIDDALDRDVNSRAAAVNQGLRDLAAARPQVRVLDWNGTMAAPPGDRQTEDVLSGDTVHPTDLGKEVLADAYLQAVEGCEGS